MEARFRFGFRHEGSCGRYQLTVTMQYALSFGTVNAAFEPCIRKLSVAGLSESAECSLTSLAVCPAGTAHFTSISSMEGTFLLL